MDASRRTFLVTGGAAAAGLAGACTTPTTAARPGSIDVSARVPAARLDAEVARAFASFDTAHVLPPFDAGRQGARFDVELHRLVTETVVPETGERVQVSGLLALPVGATGALPIVSWQHGTILSFDQVPSNLTRLGAAGYRLTDSADSLETLFNVQRFAGRGYAVIAADYLGKGPFRNGRGEAYAVKDASVRTCLDVLAAGTAAMASRGIAAGPLFLCGWSQGAINTQWLHQELRRQGRPIAATSVASPFNDLNEAWSFWAGHQTFPLPQGTTSYPPLPAWISLCMIVALGSYELQYRLDGLMESAVRPQWHALARKYWRDYAADFDPGKPFPTGADLLVPGFFERSTDERNSAFLRQLAANRASYWKYDAPIRFHFGTADEAIHPAMVEPALSAGGPFATGVAVARASHRATFLASLYGDAANLGGASNALDWFASVGGRG
jgi:hypothetical protein